MLTFFQVCFGLGVTVTLINAVLGVFFDLVDFGLDLHFDLHLEGFDFGCFLPMSPSLLFMDLTIFGGLGIACYKALPLPLVLTIGLAASFLITYLVNRFVVIPLRRISSLESGANTDFIGMTGTVSETIFENSFGKITFFFDGNTISGPAKSADGAAIEVKTEIVILEIIHSVYIVERLK